MVGFRESAIWKALDPFGLNWFEMFYDGLWFACSLVTWLNLHVATAKSSSCKQAFE